MTKLKAALLFVLVGCSKPAPEPAPSEQHLAARPPIVIDPVTKRAVRRNDSLVGRALAKVSAPWKDTRSAEQIAQASCLTPDGKWWCPAIKRSMKLGASVGGAVTPASWSVPHWAFDPANVTGCASDSNSCASATCGAAGIGPCLTHASIVGRLGTISPSFSVAVDETLLSDQASPWSDVVQLTPSLIGQGSFTFIGTLLPQLSSTIAVFTPSNKPAGTPARITATGVSNWSTACGGPTCRGMLVTDSTHPSVFWVEKDLGSGVAQITQPMLSEFSSPSSRPAYVTIANGDSITIARPTNVDMGNVFFTSFNALAAINHIIRVTLTGPVGGFGFGPGTTINFMELAESAVGPNTYLNDVTLGDGFTSPFLVNDFIDGIFNLPAATIWGGAVVGAFPDFGGIGSAGPDGGVLIDTGSTPHFFTPIQVGDVYLANSPDLDGSFGLFELGNFDVGSATLWGPAGLDLHDGTHFTCYGGCTANLLLTGTLSMHGSTTAFPWLPGSHAYGAAVTITPANIDSNNGLSDPRTGDAFLNHP